MEGIAAEVGQKLKSAIKAKLMELGAYVDDELPNYVMVMVTNRRSKEDMDRELNLFLGGNTSTFTSWLESVWTKLERVTVANLGGDKRKPLEKKKKLKKSKSSSESEDDRKHKKKRKSSTTSDASTKETKKRKSGKGEVNDRSVDVFTKDNGEDTIGKKSRHLNKADSRSVADLESDNDIDDNINVEMKKPLKDMTTVLDEDDFLNIKEDFEAEFLSEEEFEPKIKNKQVNLEHIKKASSKTVIAEKSENTPLASNKKHFPVEKSTKDEVEKVTDKSKDKENKNTENSVPSTKEAENRPKTSGKTILIRNRKVVRSRSRSRSKSRRTRSPSLTKNPSRSSGSKSVSPSRSRSTTPVSNNVVKLKEKSPVLDARELINRKRALQLSGDKIPLKRSLTAAKTEDTIHIRDDTEKEVDLREKLPAKSDKIIENRIARFLMNKGDGKRNITDGGDGSASQKKNDKIDLRKIKRTVYVRNEESDNEETDGKAKIRKSVVNQIVKYIKDDPVVCSTVVKAPKINRPKVAPVRSAGSTLIRKAVADAHKSLTTKEEPPRKREIQDGKYKTSANRKEETKLYIKEQTDNASVEDDVNDVEIISTETSVTPEQEDEDTSFLKAEKKSNEVRLEEMPAEVEEYDPSQNMPQFVVTLTGLDPKMFPEDDIEMNDDNTDTEALQNFEENKIKPKLPEQCKYYPNCLAGDQCLYHHPTIPCKMFPNCKFGSSCLYIHPKCKFDAGCTRYDCAFLHTAPRMTAPVAPRHAAPPSAISAQPCKFYYNCVNPVCPFQHPKICRYDRHCMNKNCTYQHTSLSHVNSFSMDKLKWSKPKNNEVEEAKFENVANEV